MQETPNDFCGQRCRKIFPGALGPGRVIILTLLLFGLILAPAWSQPPSKALAATALGPQFTLKVTHKVQVNEVVLFEVLPIAKFPKIEYRFHFGDNRDSGWINEPQTKYQYRLPKIYEAYAEIRFQFVSGGHESTATTEKETIDVADVRPSTPTPTTTKARERVTPSPQDQNPKKKVSPTPTPPPPPDGDLLRWLCFLGGGLLVAVVLWRVWPNNGVVPPPPTFEAHWDDTPQTTGQEKICIDYELHFDPNFSEDDHQFDVRGPKLVTAIKEVP